MDCAGRSGRSFPLASAPRRPNAPAARRAVRSRRAACEDTSRRGSSARHRRYDRAPTVETSERLNFAPVRASPQCSCARAPFASARRAWRRCGTGGSRPSARRGRARRRPRGSSGPRRRESATRRSAASTPRRACARRSRPSSARAFSAQPAAPSSSKPASAASIASRAARFCRARRLTTPSASSARARPNGSPTASCCATASLERPHGLLDLAPRRRDEAAAAGHVGQHPLTADPRRVRLPGVEQRRRHRRSGRARAAPRRSRRATSGGSARAQPRCVGCCSAAANHARSRAGVSAPELDEPQHSPRARRGAAPCRQRASRPSSARSRARSRSPRWAATSASGTAVTRLARRSRTGRRSRARCSA